MMAVNLMTMIYDPIPFVKLVQKMLVENYEGIMGICGKMFIFTLHNLQILFILRTKNTISACLSLCTNMKAPNGRPSWAGSAQDRRHSWELGGSYTQIFFVPPKFCCAQKNLFQT